MELRAVIDVNEPTAEGFSGSGSEHADRPVIDVNEPMAVVNCVAAVIRSPAEFAAVSHAWVLLREADAAFEAYFKPRKQKARVAYDQWLDDEHTARDPLQARIARAAALLSSYRIREEAEVATAARRLAESGQVEEQDRLLTEAANAERAGVAGDVVALLDATDLLDEALTTPGPAAASAPAPPVAGRAFKDEWEPTVVNKAQLIQGVASRPEFEDLVAVNVSELKRLANVFKARLPQVVPGTSVVKRRVPVKRATRHRHNDGDV